jgi:very-short-patch-repair endonuclease
MKVKKETQTMKNKKLDIKVDEKLKVIKEKILSGQSFKEVKRNIIYEKTDRIKDFYNECMGKLDQYLEDGVDYMEFDSLNKGRHSKLSPIEKLFAMAFITNRMIDNSFYEIRLQYQPEIIVSSGKKYYADFAFYYVINQGRTYENLGLLIELDGHIWHEKTPEQVEKNNIRQRDLINSGYTIMRYSGREIYKKPFEIAEECVDKYYDLVVNKMYEDYRKGESNA